jgi:hypothetical protein
MTTEKTTWVKTSKNHYRAEVNGRVVLVERFRKTRTRSHKSRCGIGSYRTSSTTTWAKACVHDPATGTYTYLEYSDNVAKAKLAGAHYAATGEGKVDRFWTDTREKWRKDEAVTP